MNLLRRHRRGLAITLITVLLLGAGSVVGVYEYGYHQFEKIPKIHVPHEVRVKPGKPFNILVIGSDSRVGLTGAVAKATGAGSVSGQRSDVVKIVHVDPAAQAISIVSIPRDTMVTLLTNQSLYTNYNRINVNYSSGSSLLVRTIEANYGIPISDVVQVSFAGLMNSATALGGVHLYFPHPAKDSYSGLDIKHAGCQLVTGFQALALVRSRHYQYLQGGVWQYDGTSDYGRIVRQDTFLKALISSAEHTINPLELNSFLGALPQGLAIDNNFSFTLRLLVCLCAQVRSPISACRAAPVSPSVCIG